MKLGQDRQSWGFSVKLQMMWSLSQEKASCPKPCPDHTSISSLALLFQLCKTEEVQGTPEQEGQTLSNYPPSCTAKDVCAQHEAKPSAQTWAPGEGSLLPAVPESSVAPAGVPWGITHGPAQCWSSGLCSTLLGVTLQLPSMGLSILGWSMCLLLTSKGISTTDYGQHRKSTLECASCGCSMTEMWVV